MSDTPTTPTTGSSAATPPSAPSSPPAAPATPAAPAPATSGASTGATPGGSPGSGDRGSPGPRGGADGASRSSSQSGSPGPAGGSGDASGSGSSRSSSSRSSSGGSDSGGSDSGGSDGGGSGGASGNGNGGEGGATGTGAPRRRRRGKRGGQRHRSGSGSGGSGGGQRTGGERADGEAAEPAASGDTSPTQTPRAPRPPRPPRPRPERPASTGDAAGGEATASGSGDEQAAAGDDKTGAATGSGGSTSNKRRRRRRSGSKSGSGTSSQNGATTTAPGDGTEAPAKEPRKQLTSAELAAAGATRLAARKLREEQRKQRGKGRRPRRMSEEEAQILKGKPKTMLIHAHEDRTQIAILEEGELIEHFVSRRGQRASMVGNVYLGKVQNVIVGMEAAFIDFGRGRNGILYANEITYTDDDLDGEIPRIEKALKPGQRLLVQVTKDPIGTKGARLSTNIALAGRYLVLAPEQQAAGVSRRLSDKERMRLRKILKDIDSPAEHGVIIRTAADGASEEAIRADLSTLLKQWNEISAKAKGAKPPAALYEEPELIMRVVRDIFQDDFEAVICDTRGVFDEIRGYLQEAAPDLVDKVSLHEGALPLFEERRVTEQLHKSLERKIWLPSGGSLIWERTEAMTVIDVNTGKFTGGKGTNLEDTVFKNNCEAAEEIARQLRLRDVGGIIIIDFIDMIDPKNQREVIRVLKTALSRDKTKSQVFDVSNLGLVEMTRKRVSEGLVEAFSETCPNCEGRGIIVNHRMD